jgi:hypothetical protein
LFFFIIVIFLIQESQKPSWYYWNLNTIATKTSNLLIAPEEKEISYNKNTPENNLVSKIFL